MKKILVVEDERDISDLIEYNLQSEGYKVKVVATGEDALLVTRRLKPDLIVLDLMLPGIQGISVLQQLKAEPASEKIPVIIVSAKVTEVDRVLGLEMGADDYVTKPFSVKELVSRVKVALRRLNTTKKGKKVKIKGLEIDYNSVSVKVGGKEVHLSPYEYKILAFLASNPNKAFSRDELLNRVWKDDAFVQPRTIDVHIRRLRTIIEKDPQKPQFIKTVRGFGYIFSVKT